MESLALLLARERLLVEVLTYKLTQLRRLLVEQDTRFVALAGAEVALATATVREAELERALLVAALGGSRGLTEPTLSDLVEDAPEPWRAPLAAARNALQEASAEVAGLLSVPPLAAACHAQLPSLADFLA